VDRHDAPMVQPWDPASKMLVWQVHRLPEERELPRKPDTLPNRLVSTRYNCGNGQPLRQFLRVAVNARALCRHDQAYRDVIISQAPHCY
jgi:hypothetical protein